MYRFVGVLAAIFGVVQAEGQTRGVRLSAAEAQRYEAELKTNPHDRNARGALLNYYFLNSGLPPAESVPARRRHILWLIENAPSDELVGLPAASIDAAGHRLADPVGFKQASAAWRAQVARADIDASALANAARFFKLSDAAFTISLLDRAHKLEPGNKEVSARLGDQYALAILGITMVNKSGYPMASDPQLAQSAAARQAREALSISRDPYALAKAGYMLSWQGKILHQSRRLAFDPSPLAETALKRAASIAPDDREIAFLVEQHRQIQGQSASQPQRAAAPAASPTRQVTADDLKTVAVGMKRDDLLKLGEPSGRLSMSEDGHLIEIYQYSSQVGRFGRIRLVDGAVAKVEVQ